jgi:hypothetical protein
MIKTQYTIFRIFLIVILSTSKLAFGQIDSNQEINSLICKPWKLKIYEVNGISQVMDTLSSNRMIFRPDHSFVFVLGDEIKNATWAYDKQTTTIIITDAETKESAPMKILILNTSNCTLESKDKSGADIKMHMVTDK